MAGVYSPSASIPSSRYTPKTHDSNSQSPYRLSRRNLMEQSADDCMIELSTSEGSSMTSLSCDGDSLQDESQLHVLPHFIPSANASVAQHHIMASHKYQSNTGDEISLQSDCRWGEGELSPVSAEHSRRSCPGPTSVSSLGEEQMWQGSPTQIEGLDMRRSSSSMRTYVVGRGPDSTAMQHVTRQICAYNRTPSKRKGAEALKERVLLRWALLHSMILYKVALGITRV